MQNLISLPLNADHIEWYTSNHKDISKWQFMIYEVGAGEALLLLPYALLDSSGRRWPTHGALPEEEL